MSLFCCENKCKCTTVAVIASVIIGIITAFLTITAVITVTPAFLWVLFGIAVVYLAVLAVTFALAQRNESCECICTALAAVLVGILGTILLSVILLAVTFEATSVIGAIITGGLLLFFSLVLSATACVVKCLANCDY